MNDPYLATRRRFAVLVVVASLVAGCTTTPAPSAPQERHGESPQGTALLAEGNSRFVSGAVLHPHQGIGRRAELAKGQHPFAVIFGCADSRTSPEVLFDQGLGDLFVVRNAGEAVDDHVLGTVEYAVEHLHVPLIVVLGHRSCGAVAAARDTVAANGHAEGHVDSLVEAIRPAVESTRGQDAEATCKENVRNVVRALRESDPVLKHAVESRHLEVEGAYYDLETGVVEFLH